MRIRIAAALLLLSTAASAVDLFCNRRQGWTIDGEFCGRCDLTFGGQVAKKQAWNVCLNCSAGCPYTKSGIEDVDPKAQHMPVGSCGIPNPAPKIAGAGEQILVAVEVDAASIDAMAQRYPIAATLLAVMASRPGAPNVFDAGSVTVGFRHVPRAGTAAAFPARGDEAMQAPFVEELPVFEQVVTEVRGSRLPSGDVEWWVLSSLETRQGSRVLEGPVRIMLRASGTRAAASMGNVGVLAPVMTVIEPRD